MSDRPRPEPTPGDRDDFALMAGIAAGDRSAFDALSARWRPRLVNFFLSIGADSFGADDCAQETLLRVYRYRDAYVPRVPFPSFLFTLARRSFLDWKRRGRRWASSGADAIDDGIPVSSHTADAATHAERLDLAAAVATLPRRLREVVEWGVLRGLPYERVASLLGIPVGTVKSRMHHAVRRLREALGGDATPDPR